MTRLNYIIYSLLLINYKLIIIHSNILRIVSRCFFTLDRIPFITRACRRLKLAACQAVIVHKAGRTSRVVGLTRHALDEIVAAAAPLVAARPLSLARINARGACVVALAIWNDRFQFTPGSRVAWLAGAHEALAVIVTRPSV